MFASFLKLFKELALYTPLNYYVFYTYRYNFTPAQLSFLCSCLDQTKTLSGSIIEIGCAGGHTTVFLNKHMDFSGIEKPYICIDTFSGFTESDINHEVFNRGKDKNRYTGFQVNKKKWFDYTIQQNGISRVKSYQADINQFDFNSLTNISFCIIDVDLYLPVKTALEKVYNLLDEGGIIVVDDCKPNQIFDGAYQAYCEFLSNRQLEKKIVLDKLGIVSK